MSDDEGGSDWQLVELSPHSCSDQGFDLAGLKFQRLVAASSVDDFIGPGLAGPAVDADVVAPRLNDEHT